MGDRGFNAGGFAYMQIVTCPHCGARRPLGRHMREGGHLRCPDKEKCEARRKKGHLLHRLKPRGNP